MGNATPAWIATRPFNPASVYLNLENLGSGQNRMEEGRNEYAEALKICRELVQKNPDVYLPDVADMPARFGRVGPADWKPIHWLQIVAGIRASRCVRYGDRLGRDVPSESDCHYYPFSPLLHPPLPSPINYRVRVHCCRTALRRQCLNRPRDCSGDFCFLLAGVFNEP
jgi:hypothetical protein